MRMKEIVETAAMSLISNMGGGGDDQVLENLKISKELFWRMLMDDEAATRSLDEMGIDVPALVDVADFMFQEQPSHRSLQERMGVPGGGGEDDAMPSTAGRQKTRSDFAARDTSFQAMERELELSEFVEALVNLRGTNQATVRDLIESRKFMQKSMATLGETLHQTCREVHAEVLVIAEEMRSGFAEATRQRVPATFSPMETETQASSKTNLSRDVKKADDKEKRPNSLSPTTRADTGRFYTVCEADPVNNNAISEAAKADTFFASTSDPASSFTSSAPVRRIGQRSSGTAGETADAAAAKAQSPRPPPQAAWRRAAQAAVSFEGQADKSPKHRSAAQS